MEKPCEECGVVAMIDSEHRICYDCFVELDIAAAGEEEWNPLWLWCTCNVLDADLKEWKHLLLERWHLSVCRDCQTKHHRCGSVRLVWRSCFENLLLQSLLAYGLRVLVMIHCSKCGVEVDTLAKRRHRCRTKKVRNQGEQEFRSSSQMIFGFYRGRGFGPRPYLRKRRQKWWERRRYLPRVDSTEVG